MLKILLTATVQSHICQFHRVLVKMLRDHDDVEIHVAAKDNLSEKNGLQLDFVDKIYNIPFSRSPWSLQNIKSYFQIKRLIESEKYDIVHCNTPVAGIITRLVSRKFKKNGMRVIYTAHGFHFYKGAFIKNWIVYYPIEKVFSRFTDVLITINDEDYSLANEKFHCPVARIHGTGVDSNRYHVVDLNERNIKRAKYCFNLNQKLILDVGELLVNKNHLMAVKAMKIIVNKFPDSVLLIAGNGPEKDSIQEEINKLQLQDNVKLIGYCTHLEEYQQICDCSVSCSVREGLGLNVIESLMVGNPVVATRNRGHIELVQNGINGYIVEQNDYINMAYKVLKIISDEELRSHLSNNCISLSKTYRADFVYKELEDIYFGGYMRGE